MSGEGNEMRKSIIVVGVGRPAFASIVSSRKNARRLAACIPGSELFSALPAGSLSRGPGRGRSS